MKPLWSLILFSFFVGQFTNCLEPKRGLLEGAKCKPARQRGKQLLFKSAVKWSQWLHWENNIIHVAVMVSDIYIIKESDKLWNPPTSSLLTCKGRWARWLSHIPRWKLMLVNYLQLLLSPIFWSLHLCIEACVIPHCVHTVSVNQRSHILSRH